MKVLFVATEMDPFFKVGGLGDVVGSLPLALSRLGLDVSVVIPLYKGIGAKNLKSQISNLKFNLEFGGQIEEVRVFEIDHQGVNVYFLENQKHITDYDKVAFAGDQKEVDHYAFFSRAVVEWIGQNGQQYDIVHLHDWHVGLMPRLWKLRRGKLRLENGDLRMEKISNLKSQISNPKGPKFIFTIHNLGYHGFSETELVKRLGIENLQAVRDDPYFEFDARDDDQLDLLLQGILSSDFVTTVSPSYAKEIQTPEYCEGLCDVLEIRSDRLVGILNGIDVKRWDPATDPALLVNYGLEKGQSVEEVIAKKDQNKQALQNELKLPALTDAVMVGFVGRLDPGQKGLDILYAAMEKLLVENTRIFQFVLIGEGNREWEEKFSALGSRFSERVSINIKFDDALARRIYAASEIVLIPSKYEPCGLVQMIAMRYGTVPVVRATGGLKDTVRDGKDGFMFEHYRVEELFKQIERVIDKYNSERVEWLKMVENAMRKDFSWGKSAREYLKVYQKLGGI